MSLLYEVRGLVRRYGRVTALDLPALGVDELRIHSGQVLTLVGYNGSGKSTLLRLLAFLEEPDEGRIIYHGGEDPRREVSLLLQEPYLLKTTVFENVVLGLKLRGRRDGLEEAYQADTKTYDKASWEYVVVSGAAESTTDADGNTVQPTDEETEAAKAAAKETADKILAAYKAGTSLESAAGNYEKASYYSSDSTTYYDGTTGNWLFDGARKSGDTAVLEVGSSYYVALFHSCGREEYNTVDVRHILIQPESGTLSTDDEGYDAEQEELKAAARTKAEEILAEWKAGDATEDSFAKLAMEDSADGSKYTGGLYTRITKGQMVEAFNDWCFDSSRKSGDTDVVDTTYGSHVMYFVGTDLPAWAAAVTDNLQTEDTNKWNEELTKDAVTEQKDFGMKFVG